MTSNGVSLIITVVAFCLESSFHDSNRDLLITIITEKNVVVLNSTMVIPYMADTLGDQILSLFFNKTYFYDQRSPQFIVARCHNIIEATKKLFVAGGCHRL